MPWNQKWIHIYPRLSKKLRRTSSTPNASNEKLISLYIIADSSVCSQGALCIAFSTSKDYEDVTSVSLRTKNGLAIT